MEVLAHVLGETGQNDRISERFRFGNVNRLPVAHRRPIQRRREAFFHHRQVYGAGNDFAAGAHGDRRAPQRQAMHEIHGAIDRIDDPERFGRRIERSALLAKNRVRGERAPDHFLGLLLTFEVEVELDVVLEPLGHFMAPMDIRQRMISGRARRFDGTGKKLIAARDFAHGNGQPFVRNHSTVFRSPASRFVFGVHRINCFAREMSACESRTSPF